jgi:alpha-tubulin suppressor-like RCC1 family protein
LNYNIFNPINKYIGDASIVNTPNNFNRLNMITWSPELGMFVAITSNNNGSDTQFYNYLILISYDGINWSNVYVPRISQYTNLNSIVWSSELSMFVVVSADSMSFTNAIVHYSYDGLLWYRIDTGIAGNSWNSVCWSPKLSLFVAVGESSSNNRIMTSSNGITWTARTAATNNNWRSVCWSEALSLFVAVSNSGTGNRIMTSSNGTTWTSQTSPADSDWRSVIWVLELSLFIAVSISSSNKIMTSPNGTTWTIRNTTSTSLFHSVMWIPAPISAIFAVGDTGSNDRIIRSINGINWTTINTTNLNIDYRTISYSPSLNLILAGGRGSNSEYLFNCIASSYTNGNSWSLIDTNYNLDWYDMIYINELSLFVTVSGNSMSSSNIIKKHIGTSPDGINWTFGYITTEYNANAIFSSITWSPTLSLAIVTTHTNDGTAIPAVYTSSDCITWTKRNVPSGNWRTVKWIPELSLFLAVSSSGSNRFITSTNGINWTANSALLPSTGIYTIDYSPSLNILIASGFGSSNNYHTSSDGGLTWTSRTLIASGVSYNITNHTCITWINQLNMFIMFQISTSTYYYSYDGLTWNASVFQFFGTTRTFTLRNITSRPIWISKFNKLYLISSNNLDENCEIYESTDGINWTNYYQITSKNLSYNNLCWSSAKNTLISFGNNTNTKLLGEPFIVLNKYIESNINYNISAINKLNLPSTTVLNESINTWVSRTSTDNNWNSICYSEDLNLYAAVASSGTNRIMTSPDSVTWTSRRAVGTDLGTVLLPSIETGLTHSIVLLSDGSLRAWGSNASGQLGTGNTTQQTTPISTTTITNAISVAAGDAFSLVLLSDGTIRSFGLNSNGQLGNGSTTNSLTPVTVTGINTAISINSGNLHSLALLSDGTVRAWGRNIEGQLGDNSTTNRLTSVAVSGITNAVAISAGNSFSLALLSNGTIRAWGNNANGQLGDGTTTNRLTPVTVSGITTAIAISASYNNHSLALLSDGTVMAWGLNNSGQIGNASGTQQITPSQVFNLQNVVSIQTGIESSFALLNNGTVQAWGRNTSNQLGEGSASSRFTPFPVSNLNNVILLSSSDHSLALLADGTLKSWGNNTSGQLGDNSITNRSINVNVWTSSVSSNILSNILIPNEIYNYNNNNWTSICWSSKLLLFAAISNSGTKNRVMISSDGITWITKPTPVDNNWTSIVWCKTLDLFVAVSNSGTNNRVMTSSNGLDWEIRNVNLNNNWSSLCYSDELNLLVAVANSGTNNRVMTSNDAITWTSRTSPTITTINSPIYIKYISASIEHSLALMSDGTVKAWGNNTYGQLGDGTTNQSNTPITVSGLSNVLGISTSTYSSFALLSDGTIKAWGYNLHGELGDGTDVDKLTPVSVTDITTAINIASGDSHGVALLSDGTVKTWGMNNDSQLGNETTISSLSPVTVSNLSNVIAIAANGSHNLALINDNTVKSWGYNDWGQLGNNSTISSSSVVNVSGLSNVKKIACGSFHSLALLNDGTVKAWGINGYGQLGNENNNDQLIPVNVSGLTNVKDIAAGYQFSLALLENGTIKSWGDNYYGKLGVNSEDNVLINTNIALTVTNITTGNSISAGGHHALAILDNGNIMSWGRNIYGQLGNNSTTNSISPINVYSSSISSDPLTNAKLIQYSSVSYNDWTTICWSSEIGLFVAVANSGSNNRIMTSPDGITWTSRTSAANNDWKSICWAKELGIFIAVASSGTNNRIMISTNGINWSTKNNIIDNDWTSICWSNGHNLAVAVSNSGTNNRVLTSTLTLPYLQSSDYLTPDVIFVNQTNGRVGLGTTNPSYQLELSSNSAAKPSTSVWSVSSDKRLKENIQNANLEMCLDIIKQLNLSKYKWKDDYINTHSLDSDKQLGWLADNVEKYLPKAVRTIQAYNYNDCKTLDSDQIIAVMYGGLKKLLLEFEEQNNKIQNLKNEIINLDNYVDQFELE